MSSSRPAHHPRHVLPVIILSQFAGTSLWFASNAVLPDMQREWGLTSGALGHLTSAVQLGFIAGTLVFALLMIADRHSPVRVFFACSVLGALANLLIYFAADGLASLLVLRFATGFFLAGIYPVGMKIAASWYDRHLGRAIGYLVGALVLGTAFPHLIKALGATQPWQAVTLATSASACLGGLLMLATVADGPHLPKGTRFDPGAVGAIFRNQAFRASSFGYFGHMWELYTFWAFVPLLLAAYTGKNGTPLDIPLWSFLIIGAGSAGSIVGGLVSRRTGSAPVAFSQLAVSGLCCLASPLLLSAPLPLFLLVLLVWGITVVGDSPQFSALSAQTAPRELVGSALTLMNCIGFAITIVSLQFTNLLVDLVDTRWLFLPLAVGPAFGLVSLLPLLRPSRQIPGKGPT